MFFFYYFNLFQIYALRSTSDQKIKNGNTGFLCSKYDLDQFKNICQDYTQKYNKIQFVEIHRRTIGLFSGIFKFYYVYFEEYLWNPYFSYSILLIECYG